MRWRTWLDSNMGMWVQALLQPWFALTLHYQFRLESLSHLVEDYHNYCYGSCPFTDDTASNTTTTPDDTATSNTTADITTTTTTTSATTTTTTTSTTAAVTVLLDSSSAANVI